MSDTPTPEQREARIAEIRERIRVANLPHLGKGMCSQCAALRSVIALEDAPWLLAQVERIPALEAEVARLRRELELTIRHFTQSPEPAPAVSSPEPASSVSAEPEEPCELWSDRPGRIYCTVEAHRASGRDCVGIAFLKGGIQPTGDYRCAIRQRCLLEAGHRGLHEFLTDRHLRGEA